MSNLVWSSAREMIKGHSLVSKHAVYQYGERSGNMTIMWDSSSPTAYSIWDTGTVVDMCTALPDAHQLAEDYVTAKQNEAK